MPLISMDALSRMMSTDLPPAEGAGSMSGTASAFNDYLHQARAQSADAAGGRTDRGGTSVTHSDDAGAAANSTDTAPNADSSESRHSRSTRPDSRDSSRANNASEPQPPTAVRPRGPRNTSQGRSKSDDSPATSSDGQSGKPPSSESHTTGQSTDSTTSGSHDDAAKAKADDAAAVVLDVNVNLMAAAAAGATATASASGGTANAPAAAAQAVDVAGKSLAAQTLPVHAAQAGEAKPTAKGKAARAGRRSICRANRSTRRRQVGR